MLWRVVGGSILKHPTWKLIVRGWCRRSQSKELFDLPLPCICSRFLFDLPLLCICSRLESLLF
jgi:hypothetical protein